MSSAGSRRTARTSRRYHRRLVAIVSKLAVEVQVPDQQALDAPVPVVAWMAAASSAGTRARAALRRPGCRCPTDAGTPAWRAGSRRPAPVAAATCPTRFRRSGSSGRRSTGPGPACRRRTADVDHHLVADGQDRPDARLDREVEPDGVPDDREAGHLDHGAHPGRLREGGKLARRGANSTGSGTPAGRAHDVEEPPEPVHVGVLLQHPLAPRAGHRFSRRGVLERRLDQPAHLLHASGTPALPSGP